MNYNNINRYICFIRWKRDDVGLQTTKKFVERKGIIMRKNKYKIICSVIILLILSVIGIYFFKKAEEQKRPKEVELPVSNLKLNDEYIYDGIEWGTTLKEVKKKLPFAIEKLDLPGTVASSDTALVTYRTDTKIILDGKHAKTASFGFQDDKFLMAQLVFVLDEDYQEWYDAQIAVLIDLYGAQSEIVEGGIEGASTTVYRWETEMTSLQFALTVKADGSAMATFAVFYKYQG